MTAATLRQMAAAAAIENRAIHMLRSSLAGSIGFAKAKRRRQAADNAIRRPLFRRRGPVGTSMRGLRFQA
jgi:hypothetical protein